jgi:hypothetical protein
VLSQTVTLSKIDYDVQPFEFAVDTVSFKLPEKEAYLNQNLTPLKN